MICEKALELVFLCNWAYRAEQCEEHSQLIHTVNYPSLTCTTREG